MSFSIGKFLILTLLLTLNISFITGRTISTRRFVAGPPLTEKELNSKSVLRGQSARGKMWEKAGLFEGDIILPTKTQSAAVAGSHRRWRNAKIPYVIGQEYSGMQRNVIANAMNRIHKLTCIRFIPRRNEKDYIRISKDDESSECRSSVGRMGGEQDIILDDICITKGTVIHELMHTIGFWHEQSRIDRDEYIKVNLKNVHPQDRGNFEKFDSTKSELLKTPYDSGSIMHYDSFAFALNKSVPTITEKDGALVNDSQVLSETDILDINRLYRCNESSNKQDVGETKVGRRPVSFQRSTQTETHLPHGFDWENSNDDQVYVAKNCDFFGNDISKKLSLPEECSELCLENPKCSHFTWGFNLFCYMKSAINPTVFASSINGAICGWVKGREGSPGRFHWHDGDDDQVSWANHCDFAGHDIMQQKTLNAEECSALCLTNSRCTHFTWGIGSVCFMKSAVNPHPLTFNGAVCGWIRSRINIQ